MKQLIKSAIVYNATLPAPLVLQEHLREEPFADLLELQAASVGFVPRQEFGSLVETFPGGCAFTVRYDQKILPGSVVNAETAKIVKEITRQGRKPGKVERREIKERVRDELLARALTKTTLITCYHHTAKNYLVVPTTNKRLAGVVVSALISAVGSVKTETIHVSNVKHGLTSRLNSWLLGDDEAFSGLHPQGEAQLEQDSRRVTVKMGDIAAAKSGLKEAIADGFSVKSLGLTFATDTSLKLTDDFQLRALSFAHPPAQDDEDAFTSEAALELQEIEHVVTFLCEMFGYEEGANQ